MTTVTSAAGRSGTMPAGLGIASYISFPITPPSSSATKRRAPVRHSQSTIAAANTSDAGLACPRICSGAMYASLPLIAPSCVTCERPRAFATPKSSTRAMPSVPTSTFWGDTSRCTSSSRSPCASLAWCAAWRPSRVPVRIAAAIAGGTRSPRSRTVPRSCASEAPWTYSRTTNSSPCEETASSVWTTFGCCTRAASRASSRKPATKAGSDAKCGWSFLIATGRENPTAPRTRP